MMGGHGRGVGLNHGEVILLLLENVADEARGYIRRYAEGMGWEGHGGSVGFLNHGEVSLCRLLVCRLLVCRLPVCLLVCLLLIVGRFLGSTGATPVVLS